MTKRAIIFDFDRTLTPGSMFDRLLEAWGLDVDKFFDDCIPLQKGDDGFDMEHSYLYLLVKNGKEHISRRLDDIRLRIWGRAVKPYPGIAPHNGNGTSLFKRLHDANGSIFIVSGGLQPVIEGFLLRNALQRFVSRVFASRMAEEEMNDGYGNRLSFPKEVVNATMKTQKLFAIKKGSWRPDNNYTVHEKIHTAQKEFNFSDMCYVGDGWNDEASFATVKRFGGMTVGVYDHNRKGSYEFMQKLYKDKRVDIILEADYREGSALSDTLEHFVSLGEHL